MGEFLSIAEFGKLAGLSRYKILRMIADEALNVEVIGKRTYIPIAEADRYAELIRNRSNQLRKIRNKMAKEE